ncbi:MAG: hypothetical protein GY847_02910 [Proteobacteria bacterium]|nr:hypothetical protein [Pseudomonadota bacterium]
MSKQETMCRLRTIIADMYNARYQGVNAVHLYRAQGLVDGYMRALKDLDIVDDGELVALVNEEKRSAAKKADREIAGPSHVHAAVDFA